MTADAPPRRRQKTIAAVIVVLVVAVVYLARLDRAAGLVVDDAWYVLLARGLAQGRGFRLTSSAVSQILPAVPPLFPAILSLVFRFSPDFPHNVLLLKSVSIAAMIGVGLTSFWYIARCRHWPWPLGVAVAVATLVTPAFVFLATSTVMAECVFTLGQLTAVIVLDRACAADRASRWRDVLLAAVLAAATTLVRASGMALLAAGALYLMQQRLWRGALLFAATAMIVLAPWTLYARAHAPTSAERVEHGGSIAYAYTDSIRLRVAAMPSSGRATFRDLRARVAENLTNVFCRDMGGMLVPAFFRGAGESGQEVVSLGGTLGLRAGSMGNGTATMVISFLLGVMALVGYLRTLRERVGVPELLVPLTIAMIVLVPFWTYRYVLPLAPFIFSYVMAALRTPSSDEWRWARLLILCVIGLDVYDHARYTLDLHDAARADAVEWVADAREVDEVLAWMRANLVRDGAVATSNPALVNLATGRKTVALDDCQSKAAAWRAHGIRYIVSLRPSDLPDRSCGPYRLLYRSARRKLWIVEI